jgi:hypothetical protein
LKLLAVRTTQSENTNGSIKRILIASLAVMNDFTSLALNAFVAVTQLLALYVMYYLAIKQFRMSKSSQYLERFLESEFLKLREFVDDYIDGRKASQKQDSPIAVPDFKHDLIQMITFANFFQELSVAYRHRLADRKYIRDVFSFLIQYYWEHLSHWVDAYREQKQRRSLYSDWEKLYHELRILDRRPKSAASR